MYLLFWGNDKIIQSSKFLCFTPIFFLHFQQFWNVFEVAILAIAYSIGLLFIWRAVLCVQSLNKISENPTSFVNMHFTVMLDDVSTISWLIAVLCITLYNGNIQAM